jgi:hypothetical protein
MVRTRFVGVVVCCLVLVAACGDGAGGPGVINVGGDTGQPDLQGGADGGDADVTTADNLEAGGPDGASDTSGADDTAALDAPGSDVATDAPDLDTAAPDAEVAQTAGPDAAVIPCDSGCPAGASCVGGLCACEAGLVLCPGGCVDLALDQANCHACGVAAAGEQCNGADDDCDGQTDENFRDDETGLFFLDNACGGCGTNCQEIYDVSHGYGVCDVSSGEATCLMVCCDVGQTSGSCDGYQWVDTNGDPANGCETAVIADCGVHGDCPDGQFCDAGTCKPNDVGGPCESDANCEGGDICVGGLCGCTGEQYASTNVPPNVLIVLDRSGSMNDSQGGGQSKWTIAKSAIGQLTASFEEQVRFGLMLYPGTNQTGNKGSNCGAGVVFIHPELSNASAVTSFLGGAGTTSYGTPTAEALKALATHPDIADPTRANVVVLITDGQSSCANPVPAVTALLAKTPSVRTFVIGFGSGVDAGELNAMAKAGGTALPGNTSYYQAGSAGSLGQALTSIAGSVLGCTFALEKAPPSLDALHAYLDGVESGRDTSQTNGWDYDSGQAQVTFYGAACESLKSGDVKKLVFIYGCDDGNVIGGG